jgi:hypothetical protein
MTDACRMGAPVHYPGRRVRAAVAAKTVTRKILLGYSLASEPPLDDKEMMGARLSYRCGAPAGGPDA